MLSKDDENDSFSQDLSKTIILCKACNDELNNI